MKQSKHLVWNRHPSYKGVYNVTHKGQRVAQVWERTADRLWSVHVVKGNQRLSRTDVPFDSLDVLRAKVAELIQVTL